MENEVEKAAEAVHVNDGVDRDWLLQHLVTHINQTQDYSMPITLWVGGGMISGNLVSGSKFFDAYTEEIVKNVKPEGKDATRSLFRKLGDRYYQPVDNPTATDTVFIHLLNARLWNPSGSTPSHGNPGVCWRGRISQITGYSLGEITITT